MEKGRFDSKLYRAVYNSYQALDRLEKSPVTPDGARNMEEAMVTFRKACLDYLAKKEGARTDRGQERYEEIERLYNGYLDKNYLIETSRDAIANREYDGMTWEQARDRQADQKAMSRLKQVIKEGQREMAKLEEETISMETAPKMLKANQEIIRNCQEYMERESRVNSGDKEAENILKGLEERNLNALRDMKKLREHEGKQWQEVKEIPIPRIEPTGPVQTVGANASVRMKIEIEKGRPGFFTEAKDSYADINVVFDRYLNNLENADLKKKLLENKDIIVNAVGNDKEKGIGQLVSDGATLGRCIEIARNQFTGEKEGHRKDGRMMRCIGEMYKEAKTAYMAISNASLQQGDKVSLRNVATTRMAELLGVERLIARSETVEVKLGDRVVKGSFMEMAQGYDAASADIDVIQKFREVKDWGSPAMVRDQSDLDVFDVICGQVDRHDANAFYKIGEMGPDGTRPLLGLMGIDNDMAFSPLVKMGKDGRLQSNGQTNETEYMNFISEDMADRIMALNREKLEYAVGDIITKEEMDGLVTRTEKMKELIQSQMFKVKEDGWNLDQYSKDDPSPEAQKFVKAVESLKDRIDPAQKYPWSMNIIGKAKKRVEDHVKDVEKEREEYKKGLDAVESMFEEADKEAAVQYEQDKVDYAERMKVEQAKEDQRERRQYMTRMEGVKSMFESEEKKSVDVNDFLNEDSGKAKKAWTYASKPRQAERKTDISISSRARWVK